MPAIARPSHDKAAKPPAMPPMGELVSQEEREHRLFFVAERMLDGTARRTLVTLSMELFGVRRRTAQHYVATVEKRLQKRAVRESPLFYLQLTKMQRDKLLESILRYTNHPEDVEPTVLADLVTAANKVLDSRDRAAVLLFQSRESQEQPPRQVELSVKTLRAETKMLRADPEVPAPPPVEKPKEGVDPAEFIVQMSEELDLPPETVAEMTEHLLAGCTPEEAVEKITAKAHGGESRPNALPEKGLSQYSI